MGVFLSEPIDLDSNCGYNEIAPKYSFKYNLAFTPTFCH